MTALELAEATSYAEDEPDPEPVLELVIPVYNEERALDANIRRLHRFLDGRFPFTTTITIADNASSDGTWAIAQRLCRSLRGVTAFHLDQKGRGGALRTAWSRSDALVVGYMDVDLATDLDGLLPLVAPLVWDKADVGIGTRLARGARVTRGLKRESVSRSYNLLVRAALGTRFSDAQCGFKALRSEVARRLLPLVADNGWFFDTELLAVAEHEGMRIHEVPVDWVDDPDSRVRIVSTAIEDLRGLRRLRRTFAQGPTQVAPLHVAPPPSGRTVNTAVGIVHR